MNYLKNLFYKVIIYHYDRKAYNYRIDAEEAEYQAQSAEDNSAIWLRKIREMGL